MSAQPKKRWQPKHLCKLNKKSNDYIKNFIVEWTTNGNGTTSEWIFKWFCCRRRRYLSANWKLFTCYGQWSNLLTSVLRNENIPPKHILNYSERDNGIESLSSESFIAVWCRNVLFFWFSCDCDDDGVSIDSFSVIVVHFLNFRWLHFQFWHRQRSEKAEEASQPSLLTSAGKFIR